MVALPPAGAPPAFLTASPPGAIGPVVIAVPHAGRFYPAEVEQERAVSWPTLRELEDRYADRLIGRAVAEGAFAVIATHARAWLDLNRAEDDRDGSPSSPHGRAGLGLVPQRLAGRRLWKMPPPQRAVDERVAAVHRPYHAAVAAALSAARARHGFAVLVDCHSMPPLPGDHPARLVIGDRHGSSAAPEIVDRLIDVALSQGLRPARNRPYAGAYGLARHGRPDRDVHALQLEYDRSLYLDADLREPSVDLTTVIDGFAQLCAVAAERPAHESQRQAAE